MLRFAASPTGDMHIGDLRVAIFNYIVSKQRCEDLIVRIEDIDKEKNIEGKDQEILDLLGLFGIEHSQVIYQSQHVRFHTAMALQLLHEAKAFNCFCSDNWLDKKREEAKDKNEAYKYDDACANLPHELIIDNTNPFTVRVKKSANTIVIKDYIKGEISFKPEDEDSFVIMKQDKTPTDNFTCAVDDMLSDISLVIRDEENLSNTPKQELVRSSLNYDKKIEYAHLPKILNDLSVKELLEDGYLPSAIANYLIFLGNKTPKEIFTLNDSIEWFKLENISQSEVEFSINMLKDINREHLKMLDAKELSRYVGFADAEIGELARVYLDEAFTTKELKSKIKPIFEKKTIPDELKEKSKTLEKAIKDAPYFDEYEEFKNHIMSNSGLEDEEFSKVLLVVLTGAQNGPDIAKIYKYLKNYIGEIVK